MRYHAGRGGRKGVIIFDFDGVLIDSVDEILVNAYNAAQGTVVFRPEEIPPKFTARFRLNCCRPRNAAEMVVLAKWCLQEPEQGLRLLPPGEFEYLAGSLKSSKAELQSLFFLTRNKFVDQNRTQWLALSTPYEPLWSGLKKCMKDPLVILTNKNARAVADICAHHGIAVRSDCIFSGDSGASKTENFRAIQQKFPGRRYHFIDDALTNLLELKRNLKDDQSVSLALALWGYVTADDQATAERENLLVYTQETLLQALDRLQS